MSQPNTSLADLPRRPAAPILLRPCGGLGDAIGMNTDCFTVGTVEGVDAPLPESVRPAGNVKLRFVRAAEGWRVALVEGSSLFVNQSLCRNASSLEAGDLLRFVPGGPGLQFTLVPDRAEPLARLAARYAPQLLGSSSQDDPVGQTGGFAMTDRLRSVPWWAWGLAAAAGLAILTLVLVAAATGTEHSMAPEATTAEER